MKTTTLPQYGWLYRTRNNQQCKPSFAIKSDKSAGNNHPKPSVTTGSERKEPQERVQENTKSMDHQTIGIHKQRPDRVGRARAQGDRTAQQRPHNSPTHRSSRRGHRPVTKPPHRKSRWRTNRVRRRTKHEGQPRLQTPQRTGAVETAGQKRTHPKAR